MNFHTNLFSGRCFADEYTEAPLGEEVTLEDYMVENFGSVTIRSSDNEALCVFTV